MCSCIPPRPPGWKRRSPLRQLGGSGAASFRNSSEAAPSLPPRRLATLLLDCHCAESCWALWNEEIVLFCISIARFVFGARILTRFKCQFISNLVKSRQVKLTSLEVVVFPSPFNGGTHRGTGARFRGQTLLNLLACACAAAPAKPWTIDHSIIQIDYMCTILCLHSDSRLSCGSSTHLRFRHILRTSMLKLHPLSPEMFLSFCGGPAHGRTQRGARRVHPSRIPRAH